ncbi:MAG: cob(I)yrinic acid a,c-diamide adenosyltransferase [Fidelibacterota bacterium]
MIIVYTGNGKGKTSAALGTVFRASGYFKKSCIIQFIKDGSQYGEHYAVQHYLSDLVDMFQAGKGFYKIAGDKFEETDHKKAAAEAMELAYRMLGSKKYDLIVLDEILTAGMVKLIAQKEIIDLIHAVPDTVHCILTGREAGQDVVKKADLVTDMQEIKHPYQLKKPAQEGIDY